MSNNDQKQIADAFDQKPILYIPGLTNVTGSVTASLMLSQLLYWNGKGRRSDGWFYKTEMETQYELSISPKQQRLAEKKLLALGLIEKRLAGTPPKRHYRVNVSLILSRLSAPIIIPDSLLINTSDEESQNLPKVTYNTDNTTDITSKNTTDKLTNVNSLSANSVSDILKSKSNIRPP